MISFNDYIIEKLHISKDSKIKIDIEDIKDRDTAITYIKSLDYKVEDVESIEHKGKAVRIYFNDKLSMTIDFINRIEYLYTLYGPGDNILLEINSTSEADSTDWSRMLDIRKFADHFKKLKARFGRHKDMIEYYHKLADKIYALM